MSFPSFSPFPEQNGNKHKKEAGKTVANKTGGFYAPRRYFRFVGS